MAEDAQPTYILDDLPAEVDALDFRPYVEALAAIIESPNTHTPLTIGVFGGWGSGKTSLLRMLRKRLKPGYRVAWFDAWKYEKEETLWRALLLQALAALRQAVPKTQSAAAKKSLAQLDDLEAALYRTVEREELGRLQIDGSKLATGVAQGVVQIGLSFIPGVSTLTKMVEALQEKAATDTTQKIVEAFQREHTQVHIDQVQFLDQFQARFSQLVAEHISKKKRRLVVFVDDLDRCMPEKAVEVLEAIKLFLDVKDCIFLLALDPQVIARGVELKYRELGLDRGLTEQAQQRFLIEGTQYLEKIIQLPFQLPQIDQADMDGFVSGLVGAWPHPACPEVFAAGLGDNPRQVKRTVNVFLLLWQLAAERHLEMIKPVRLAKVVAVQHISPQFYELLKENPRLLRDLEAYYRAESLASERDQAPFASQGRGAGAGTERSRSGEEERVEPPPALAPFVGRAALRRVLTLHPEIEDAGFSDLPPDEIRQYFTLARRVETLKIKAADQVSITSVVQMSFEPQLVRVPAGSFLMGSSAADKKASADEKPQHSVELSEYWIGKYPITNLEYQAFVKEAGHWAPRGWEGLDYPPGKGDHPVVNVSWEDAQAYCRWLSEKTSKPYRLPTEAEWEKAARSADGRIYPWGDIFEKEKCNTEEAGIKSTTPVGKYSPAGDSPFGCVDMAGNVWEWCADRYAEDEYARRSGSPVKDPQGPDQGTALARRVVRGGSWTSIVTTPSAPSAPGSPRMTSSAIWVSGWSSAPVNLLNF